MEAVVAIAILAVLVFALVFTSRRWGRPRLYVRGVVALWLVAAIIAALVLWLAFD